MAKFIEYL